MNQVNRHRPNWPVALDRPILLLLVIFIFYSHLSLITCQYIEIQTELGRLRGVRFSTQLNNPAIAFLGVPYALPPLGERRFKV